LVIGDYLLFDAWDLVLVFLGVILPQTEVNFEASFFKK
jgi:hypothetical protein